MGEIIYLGIDYSTGEPREDKAEYYEERKHAWLKLIKNFRITSNQITSH